MSPAAHRILRSSRLRGTSLSGQQVGDTAWVAEGKLSYIIGDNKEKDPGAFAIKPVPLPK